MSLWYQTGGRMSEWADIYPEWTTTTWFVTPEPVITEDENDDPPAQDDGLGETSAEPFDPADVDENDTRTPEDV